MGSVDPGFSFTILDTIFEENEAEGNGGGIHVSFFIQFLFFSLIIDLVKTLNHPVFS